MAQRSSNSGRNTGRTYSHSGTHFDSGNSRINNQIREFHTTKIRQADIRRAYEDPDDSHLSNRNLASNIYERNNYRPNNMRDYNNRRTYDYDANDDFSYRNGRSSYRDDGFSKSSHVKQLRDKHVDVDENERYGREYPAPQGGYPARQYGRVYDDYHRDYDDPRRGRYYPDRYNSNYYPPDNYGYRKPKKKKKHHVVLWVLLGLFVCFLVLVGLNLNYAYKQYTTLKSQAEELKDELKLSVIYLKDMSYSKLSDSIEKVDELSAAIKVTLQNEVWEYAEMIPEKGEDVQEVKNLIAIVDEVSDEVLKPFCAQIKDNSIDNIKVDDGYDVRIILSYFDLLEDLIPEIQNISKQMGTIHLSSQPGLLDEYIETLDKIVATYEEYKEYIPLVKTLLNVDEPRLYMLVPQNSAEIRASDGFPGSMGTIRINDGIMTVGDFQSVYDVLASANNGGRGLTWQESYLFGELYTNWAHDACFNPDFDRVCQIWTEAYMDQNWEYVDGVISMTPAVIQELLAVCGETTLSDGTVINGTNAAKVLQHDLYYKYLSSYNDYELALGNYTADALFAETAKTVMGMITDDLSISKMKGLVQVLANGQADRTIMMWMAEAEEEAIIEEFGYSGKLNSDPNNPVAGVYFSFSDPCKLGWFVNIDTRILETTTLDDGRIDYSIKVSFTNNADWDDVSVGPYIAGNYNGSIQSSMYFFAPAGGTIYNFSTSLGFYIQEDNYEGLNLGFQQYVYIEPGETIDVYYNVITAAGVTTPLKIETTPTLQKYREAAEAAGDTGYITPEQYEYIYDEWVEEGKPE